MHAIKSTLETNRNKLHTNNVNIEQYFCYSKQAVFLSGSSHTASVELTQNVYVTSVEKCTYYASDCSYNSVVCTCLMKRIEIISFSRKINTTKRGLYMFRDRIMNHTMGKNQSKGTVTTLMILTFVWAYGRLLTPGFF